MLNSFINQTRSNDQFLSELEPVKLWPIYSIITDLHYVYIITQLYTILHTKWFDINFIFGKVLLKLEANTNISLSLSKTVKFSELLHFEYNLNCLSNYSQTTTTTINSFWSFYGSYIHQEDSIVEFCKRYLLSCLVIK